ncbi:hypothetical protein PHLCEN_2v13090 [Hermanssonia centrifuga]|uniref:Uncharacterized protein n=1 Tax=Hermanssonia centrifuga TaxID=98765 RepID=A0A2R6NGD1_9APHY|nr:hypothetical protein PHLCEN_2v13090 [Hermanssonia centrifuga]
MSLSYEDINATRTSNQLKFLRARKLEPRTTAQVEKTSGGPPHENLSELQVRKN